MGKNMKEIGAASTVLCGGRYELISQGELKTFSVYYDK